jgi:predicted transcriptional regulator
MKHLFLPIKPEYAEKILNGTKTVEVRRRKPKLTAINSGYLFLYSVSPVCAVTGYAKITIIDERSPASLWTWYNDDINITKKEYDSYVKEKFLITGIFLYNPKRIKPIGIDELRKFGIKNFQSFSYVDEIFLSLIKKDFVL